MQKCPVRGKIKCIFDPKVIQSSSTKRKGQQFKVIASEALNKDVFDALKEGMLVAAV